MPAVHDRKMFFSPLPPPPPFCVPELENFLAMSRGNSTAPRANNDFVQFHGRGDHGKKIWKRLLTRRDKIKKSSKILDSERGNQITSAIASTSAQIRHSSFGTSFSFSFPLSLSLPPSWLLLAVDIPKLFHDSVIADIPVNSLPLSLQHTITQSRNAIRRRAL